MLDSLNLWDATASLPDQIGAATRAAGSMSIESLPRAGEISGIVTLGVGASGLAAEIVTEVSAQRARVPVAVVKDRSLPAWVGPSTLVFAISWSGDTEETLEAMNHAVELGASVVAVSQGGELLETAKEASLTTIVVPGGIPQARSALGALCVPPLVVLERIGVLDGITVAIEQTCSVLNARRDELVSARSRAGEVARRIGRSIPLIYGSSGVTSVVARRWKTQINQDAKSPAFFSNLSEACHDEIAGWGQLGDVTRQIVTWIALRHRGEHPSVVRQFAFVSEVLDEVVADTVEVWSEAECDIAVLFDLILFGDFVSLHLAKEGGIDPGPVPIVADLDDAIKNR